MVTSTPSPSSPPPGEWPALTSVTHRDDAVDGGPWIHLNNRPLLSLLLAKLASSTSPQKPPATYTRVSDFWTTYGLDFLGATYTRERLICEYIRYYSDFVDFVNSVLPVLFTLLSGSHASWKVLDFFL